MARPTVPQRVASWIGQQLVRWNLATIPEGRTRTIIERETHRSIREASDVPGGAFDQDYGYRRLSASTRDMTPIVQDRAIKMSQYLWMSDPIAHRVLQVLRDLIVADGFTPQSLAKDPSNREACQEVLDKFWNDPVNQWDTRMPERVLELLMTGEQPWRAFVRRARERSTCPECHAAGTIVFGMPTSDSGDVLSSARCKACGWQGKPSELKTDWVAGDGRVRLGQILPENIANVLQNPTNAEQLTHIEVKTPVEVQHEDGRVEQRTFFEIMRVDERPGSPTAGEIVGEVFFWSINRLSGATRGLPELLPVCDWIDMLEQLLYSETERAQIFKSFVWDITLKGRDENGIKDWREQNSRPPKPGTVRAHNENEVWQAVTPNLNLKETIDYIKFLLVWIMGGVGIPEHYFAEANTVNKASAAEMDTPVFANIRTKQKQFKDQVEFMLLYVLQEAKRSGNVKLRDVPIEDMKVALQARDPEQKAETNAGQDLNTSGQALAQAEAANWITPEQAGRAFRARAIELGYKLDEDDSNTALLTTPGNVKKPPVSVLEPKGAGAGGAGAGGAGGDSSGGWKGGGSGSGVREARVRHWRQRAS